MNRTILPEPPNPNSAEFRSDFASWQRAVYRWMQQAKNRIETDSAANIQPMGPLAVSTYTAVATITGTDATSNCIATLVAMMQNKGLTAPVTPRSV